MRRTQVFQKLLPRQLASRSIGGATHVMDLLHQWEEISYVLRRHSGHYFSKIIFQKTSWNTSVTQTCSPTINSKIKVEFDLSKRVQLTYGCFGILGGVLYTDFRSLYTHPPINDPKPSIKNLKFRNPQKFFSLKSSLKLHGSLRLRFILGYGF